MFLFTSKWDCALKTFQCIIHKFHNNRMGSQFCNNESIAIEHMASRNIMDGTWGSIAVVPQKWNIRMEWLELMDP
jgi:hypothetical protein